MDWFNALTTGNKIAVVGILVGAFIGIVAILVSVVIYIKSKKSSAENNRLVQEIRDELRKQGNPSSPPSLEQEQERGLIDESLEKIVVSKDVEKKTIARKLAEGSIDDAVALFNKIIVRQKETIQTKKNDLVENLLELAAIQSYLDPDASLSLLSEAVSHDPINVDVLNRYALLLMRMGKVIDAKKQLEEALLHTGSDQQARGAILGNLGLAYYRLGEVEKAIGYYEEALEISREIKDRHGEGSDLGNLGLAYYRLGEVEKARQYYLESLKIFTEIKSPNAEIVRRNLKKLDD